MLKKGLLLLAVVIATRGAYAQSSCNFRTNFVPAQNSFYGCVGVYYGTTTKSAAAVGETFTVTVCDPFNTCRAGVTDSPSSTSAGFFYIPSAFGSTGNYRVFAWSSDGHWGSSNIPLTVINHAYFNNYEGAPGILAFPVPVATQNISPTSNEVVMSPNFTIEWTHVYDSRYYNLPVTYDVYYKYWPYGGTEPANFSLSGSYLPCNQDAAGYCSTPVTNMPNGNYRWYVLTRLDVSSESYGSNQIGVNSAPTAFNVGDPGRLPGCCR
jgi:hypothetical protein